MTGLIVSWGTPNQETCSLEEGPNHDPKLVSAFLRKWMPEKIGVPWMVIIDPSGKELASSFGPNGNIGYPYQTSEISHFLSILRETRQRLTDDDLAKIEADLHAYRADRESHIGS